MTICKCLHIGWEGTLMLDQILKTILVILSVVFIILLSQFIITAKGFKIAVEQFQEKDKVDTSKYHLILIAQEYNNPYWEAIRKGAEEAGKTSNILVEYKGPIRSNMEEQLKLLEKSIASNPDGIIVQSLNDEKFSPLIDKAIAKGIPVITIDTDAPSSKRLSYVGTDNYFAGQMLGFKVVKEMNGKGNVGVIIGDISAENQKLRLNGFQSVIEKQPNMDVIEVLSSNISKVKAGQQAEKILRKHPEVSALVGTSVLDAPGILDAKEKLQRKDVLVFGFDDLEETINAIKLKKVVATMVQKPFQMGYQSVTLMNDYFHHLPIPKQVFTNSIIIDSTNVDLE